MSEAAQPGEFDYLGLEERTMKDPYVLYRTLLENAPVFREPTYGIYLVTRYEDIQEMKRNPARFSNAQPTGPTLPPSMEDLPEAVKAYLESAQDDPSVKLSRSQNTARVVTLLAADPPAHTRYRGMTNKVLNARTVKGWEPRVAQIANDLIDDFIDEDELEWVRDFAHPLPLRAVGEILGIPPGDDDLLDTLFGGRDVGDTIGNPTVAMQQLADGSLLESMAVYTDFFTNRIAKVRENPVDGDFLSDLVRLEDSEGEILSDAEILSIVSHFQAAGHETSTKMITQAMYQLAKDADLFQAVRNDRSLVDNLLEESLRFEAPVQGLFQIAQEDVEVGGVDIPKGAMLMTIYGAANHDPRQFENPEVFDIHRRNARSHLSFGGGIHSCLGRPLARAEGVLGFNAILDRVKSVSLVPGKNTLERTNSFILRGIRELYINIEAA